MTDLKMKLLCSLRGKDVELTEDLYRRMGPCQDVAQLNSYFHGLLAQYPSNTMDLRAELLVTTDFDKWHIAFVAKVLPYLVKKRLPSCTDTNLAPIYGASVK